MATSREIIERLGGCTKLARSLNESLPQGWRPVSVAAVRMWMGRGIPGKFHLLLLDLAQRHSVALGAEELLATKRNTLTPATADQGKGGQGKHNRNIAQGVEHDQ